MSNTRKSFDPVKKKKKKFRIIGFNWMRETFWRQANRLVPYSFSLVLCTGAHYGPIQGMGDLKFFIIGYLQRGDYYKIESIRGQRKTEF